MRCMLAVVCTLLSGFVGIWLGAFLDVAAAGGVICAVACMGGFLLSAIEEKRS